MTHSKSLLCVLSAIGVDKAPRLHAALYISTGELRWHVLFDLYCGNTHCLLIAVERLQQEYKRIQQL